MPIDWSDEDYELEGKNEDKYLEPAKCYEGRSDRDDRSSWRDLHLAVQRAAAVAAQDLGLGPDDEEWFEVSRIRVLVGNPNVKIYSVHVMQSHGGGGH